MKSKILLIGYGYWGKIWYKTINESTLYEFVGVVDPVFFGEKKQETIIKPYYFANLEDVDCQFTHAIIATPAETHLATYRILKQKFNIPDENILVEKPVGLCLEEAEEMKNCCHDFVWLYDATYLDLKKYIKDIGKIKLIQTTRASMGPRIRTDVSILEDYLFHDIYLYLDLFNSDIDSINFDYYSVDKLNFRHHDSMIKQDTITISAFDTMCGIKLQMFSSWVYPQKTRKWVIVGDKGSIIWENDSIFINYSNFEKNSDSFFVDDYGNIGYQLNINEEKTIKTDLTTIRKSNLRKLLDVFMFNQFSKIENDLVIKTHNFINKMLNY